MSVKPKSKAHRIYNKQKHVHIHLLKTLEEISVMLNVDIGTLKRVHTMGSLPFVSFEIGGIIIGYIPEFILHELAKVKKAGGVKLYHFMVYIEKNKLTRLYKAGIDWDSYDLSEFKDE